VTLRHTGIRSDKQPGRRLTPSIVGAKAPGLFAQQGGKSVGAAPERRRAAGDRQLSRGAPNGLSRVAIGQRGQGAACGQLSCWSPGYGRIGCTTSRQQPRATARQHAWDGGADLRWLRLSINGFETTAILHHAKPRDLERKWWSSSSRTAISADRSVARPAWFKGI